MNKVQVLGERGAARVNEDDAIITMAMRGMNDNYPDVGLMDEPARADAAGRIQVFLEDIAALTSTKIRWKECRFYDIDPTTGKLTANGDPIPLGDFTGSSGAQALPPQIACAVTFKTAKRKNWGRFYCPSLTVTSLASDGGFDTGALGTIADAAAALTGRDDGKESAFTVWSPTERTHHDPQSVQVDDIPDVIRSRRFSQALHRETRDAG